MSASADWLGGGMTEKLQLLVIPSADQGVLSYQRREASKS
jgi:hypothetical protein